MLLKVSCCHTGQWEGDELPDKQHPRYWQQEALGMGERDVVTFYLIGTLGERSGTLLEYAGSHGPSCWKNAQKCSSLEYYIQF